jgi:hypothetical protein
MRRICINLLKQGRFLSTLSITVLLASVSQAGIIFSLSAPGVQQSARQGQSGSLTEDFNGFSTGALTSSGNLAIGSYTPSGGMQINNADLWGGAGGTGKYAFTFTPGSLTVNLSTPSKYLGVWWTATSTAEDFLDFYSGGNLIGTMSGQTLTDLVGPKNAPNQVLASDGQTYSGSLWYGNPNGTFPVSAPYIFAYVNVGFSDPNTTFDRVVFNGGYFEFDNVTTSTSSLIPAPVPEPTSLAAWGLLAASGVTNYIRRKKNAQR